MPENEEQSGKEEDEENDSNTLEYIHFRADAEQKQEWEEYVENSDMYTSLSDFIRKAAVKEITRDEDGPKIEVEEIKRTVEEEISSVREEMEQLKTDVAWLRSKEEHNIEEFAHRLFSVLEPVPTGDPEEEASAKAILAGMEPQRKEDLADKLNSNIYRVNEALEWLDEHNMPVMKYEIDGESHYFRDTKERGVNA